MSKKAIGHNSAVLKSALFDASALEVEASPPATQEDVTPSRIRTTVTLLPKTMDILQYLKWQGKRNKGTETLGELIDESVAALITQNDIVIPDEAFK